MHIAAVSSVTFAPVVHPVFIALLIAGAVLLSIRAVRTGERIIWPPQRARLHAAGCGALRLLALLGLAAVLLNPVRAERGPGALRKPGVLLMVDTSSSMCVTDERDGGQAVSRIDRLRRHWLDPVFLERAAQHAHVRLVAFDSGSRALGASGAAEVTASGSETQLVHEAISAIEQADEAIGSMVLLTDGRDTTGAAASTLASAARRRGITISSVPVGTTAQQPDLNVRLSADRAFVHDGQSVTLRGEINQVGLSGQHVTAILERNGQVIDSAAIVLGDSPARLSFDVTPVGPEQVQGEGEAAAMVSLCEFRLRIEPLPAESRTDNNANYAFVQVTRQHIRVVLFENEPYWDTKYLIAALRSAAEIDLTTVIGIGRREEMTRYVSESAGPSPDEPAEAPLVAPIVPEHLSRYDVVILGRGIERWFPGEKAEMLVEYVAEHGGSLVLARGRPFGGDSPAGVAAEAALDPIVPVQWGGEVVSAGRLRTSRTMAAGDPLSFEGLGNTDLILSQMPGMIAQTRIDRERAASIIWARTDARDEQGVLPAAVATQQVGHGRVLAVLVDGLWKWALLPPESADLDPVFPLFWTRAVRWLAGGGELLPGQSVGLSLSRLNVQPGQSVEITVQTRYVDAAALDPAITVIGPDGSSQTLEPAASNDAATRLTALLRPEEEGLYTVRLDCPGMQPQTLTSRFIVHDPSRERLDLSADHAPLIALAEATGGHVYDAARPQTVLDDLRAEAVAAEIEPVTEPIWDRAWLLTLLLSLLGIEWLWRRATGQL